MELETIFGVATPIGKSGVAVIRISGNAVPEVAALLGLKNLRPRYAEYTKLRYKGEIIDEAVALYFKAPASFTGEDVLELQVHGSRAVIKTLLEILGAIPGVRMAEPGEFSRRAFENGRMDLTAAEGLADLIDAETSAQAKQAMRQMQGELGRIYDSWRDEMVNLLALIEAYIDFPDEDLPPELKQRALDEIEKFRAGIKAHMDDNRRGEKIREGLYVAILGAPNVGKSSLLNYLVKREAAIVSETAGTTRDVIEVNMEIAGLPVTFADTAGLRETSDAVESEGIKRALQRAEQADFKIVMFEAGRLDAKTSELIDSDSIVLVNKTDKLGGQFRDDALHVSVANDVGMDNFLAALQAKIIERYSLTESPLITRARHRDALADALNALEQFSLEKPIELIAEDLRYAARALGRITGKIDVEEVLGKIFSSFCIGK